MLICYFTGLLLLCVPRARSAYSEFPFSLHTLEMAAASTHRVPMRRPSTGFPRRQSAPDIMENYARQGGRRSNDIPRQNDSDQDDDLMTPTVFTWPQNGREVLVTGSWDDWSTRTPLFKNGREFMTILYIPIGQIQFKFLVDGSWRCAAHIPMQADGRGNTNNVMTIVKPELEFDTAALVDEVAPSSPLSSYTQNSTADFATDPPVMPPHLEARVLKPLPESVGKVGCDGRERPFESHVYLEHLYQAKEVEGDVQSLSQTSRIGKRVVNTIFITTRGGGARRIEENGFGHPG